MIDPASRRARHLLVGGVPVLEEGVVTGRGGTLLTIGRGRAAAEAHGLPVRVLDLSTSLLHAGSTSPVAPRGAA